MLSNLLTFKVVFVSFSQCHAILLERSISSQELGGGGGRLSDIELVNKSEFLTKVPHHTRNQILADQGFPMKDEFACIAAVQLLTPAFN